MLRAAPRFVSVLVTVAVLAITVVLAWLAALTNAHSNERLLERQVAQAGSVLETQVAVVQSQLGDAAQVAQATNANADAFRRFAAARVAANSPFRSLSLWRVDGAQPELVATQGDDPVQPAAQLAQFFSRVKPDGRLAIAGILPGDKPRLGTAFMPAGSGSPVVVYAEQLLPPGRHISVPASGPFGGIDFAVYLGRGTASSQLLEATTQVPIRGNTATATIPYGDTTITVVGASPTHLTGALSASLWWIVLAVGVVLALSSGAVVETIARRQRLAEGLAADNERLYHQQRSIAGTLQHALLPDLPEIPGVEAAARYVAGEDELEVGGDWYDVIPRSPGCCVFVVGDVSGRGLKAATTMASLRFAVRAFVSQGDDVIGVMTKLRGLLDVDTDHQFATVLLGELDAADGRITLVSAGHLPALLVAGGRAELLDIPVSPPIGIATAAAPTPRIVRAPGPATLVAFTDGLVERRGEILDAGLERLRSSALGGEEQPLGTVVDRLVESVASDGRKDDTVIVGLRWPR